MRSFRSLMLAAVALPLALAAVPAIAQMSGGSMSSENTVMVGGAPMYRRRISSRMP